MWFVANQASRSTDAARIAAITDALFQAGATIVGTSDFPRQPAPAAAALTSVDTLVIMGGDGTINSASAAARGWPGQVLAIPGGTMNLLPRALHGDAAPEAIVAAAASGATAAAILVHVPVVRVGDQTSYCRIIIGAMTRWARARKCAA